MVPASAVPRVVGVPHAPQVRGQCPSGWQAGPLGRLGDRLRGLDCFPLVRRHYSDEIALGGLQPLFSVPAEISVPPSVDGRTMRAIAPDAGDPHKATGKTQWSVPTCVSPACCTPRMVRPSTLGGTLISAGTLDGQRFPSSRVVTRAISSL